MGFIGISISLLNTDRFLLEFFKENQVAFDSGLFVNMGQFHRIPFILVGLVIAFKNRSERADKINEF
jgi:phosphatidylglycerol:prolipoprotein diacylglycerol transferase